MASSLIGQYHVVAINRGTKHGLETGHVLAIDQKGEVVDDTARASVSMQCPGAEVAATTLHLPSERAGTLLVFRTYDRMSYGLVVSATGADARGRPRAHVLKRCHFSTIAA